MSKIFTLLGRSPSTPNHPPQPQSARASLSAEQLLRSTLTSPSIKATFGPSDDIITLLGLLVEASSPSLSPLKPSPNPPSAGPTSFANPIATTSGDGSSASATQKDAASPPLVHASAEATHQACPPLAELIAALQAGTISLGAFQVKLDSLVDTKVTTSSQKPIRNTVGEDGRRFVLTQLAQTTPAIDSATETEDILFAWRRWYELGLLSFRFYLSTTIGAPRWMDDYCWQAFNIALRNCSNALFLAFARTVKFRTFGDVLHSAARLDHPLATPPPPAQLRLALLELAAQHRWQGPHVDSNDQQPITALLAYAFKAVDIICDGFGVVVWPSTEKACLELAWEAVPADWQILVLERGDPHAFTASHSLFLEAFDEVTFDMQEEERLRQQEERVADGNMRKLSDPILNEIFGDEGLVLDCETMAVATGLVTKRW